MRHVLPGGQDRLNRCKHYPDDVGAFGGERFCNTGQEMREELRMDRDEATKNLQW